MKKLLITGLFMLLTLSMANTKTSGEYGISESNLSSMVYPNPSMSQFVVSTKGRITKVKVFNIIGAVVYTLENILEGEELIVGED